MTHPTPPSLPTLGGWRPLAALAGTVVGAGLLGGLGLLTTPVHPQSTAVKVADAAPERVRYGREIRPILSDKCFQCHGPDAGTVAAGLRLDIRDEAIAARKGGAAIVPGDPDKSELIRRVCSDDPAIKMPPADSNKSALTARDRELLRQWIAEGAEYESHWAFQSPTRPATPAAKNTAWMHNPIDAFVLARLEKDGIAPSEEADRPSLLRRVFLDLTGLPPTPEEVDAFLGDTTADAYEKWVNRLLTEEPYRTRYAERMTAPWLDQSRYADTTGIHMDAGRQMWLWRDWVLNAYRNNMPFDQFVTEQLAGDLIPDATVSQKIASGFNRNHVITDEGGAINEEYLVEYAVDRASTTGSVFLGLTVGCARCHDHKFDPISAEEFYSFYAFFNSIEEPGLYSQTPDSNRAYEPFIVVPTDEQRQRLTAIENEVGSLRKALEERTPAEEAQRAAFTSTTWNRAGVSWSPAIVTTATSTGGATMDVMEDGSVRATGTNPAKDDHVITLRIEGIGLRLLMLEALEEPTAADGRIGRAHNGNVVVSGITIQAISVADPSKSEPVNLMWAWADRSQQNGDYDVTNLLDPGGPDSRGWALQGHEGKGSRVAILLADKPFGFEGGTDLKVTLEHRSMYSQHVLARSRIGVGSISDAGLALLPTASSRWYIIGPFPGDDQNRVWEPVFGPEEGDRIDLTKEFTDRKLRWQFDGNISEGRVVELPAGRTVTYLGKRVYSPTARDTAVSLGSDDGFRLYANGVEAVGNNTERGAAPDQDKGKVPLAAGRNAVVMKIVNTGGAGGFYYTGSNDAELAGDLVGALAPLERRSPELAARVDHAWRSAFLPRYRETDAKVALLDQETAELNAKAPRTMVMKELPTPRDTYVLTRGVYDQPDKARPVSRGVPKTLGKMPADAPNDRLGLARWIMSPENPLTARVTVNRLWEQFFGTGIVATSEDFGLQGEWPSHPELLDWLAVEFRDSGWDVQHMIRLIVTSATYRQRSTIRPEMKEIDAANRLLASYPRRRLSAEQIRDQALYVSGLLVEKMGGPSVKPYQPAGLWQEVAMPQSNTRVYVRGDNEDLWRRSMYTYWKRAAPPPSMLTFDAPTREACLTRRTNTSTPLQALVLWNDEQFQEAARVLAARALKDAASHDRDRLIGLFRRCVARAPDAREVQILEDALTDFRERYVDVPWDATGVISAGESPLPEGVDRGELAAWTMVASALLNLYETTTQE